MSDSSSEKTLMALFALEAERAALDVAASPGGAPIARLPSLDKRVEMFARAMYGSDVAISAEIGKAAREQILTAMAADLLEETTEPAARLQPPELTRAQLAMIEAGTPAREGLSRFLAGLGDALQRLISAATEGMTVRRLSMAAVPLVGVLAAGAVLTGNWGAGETESGKNPAAVGGAPASGPVYRSLQPAPPVDTASEQNLQKEIAADQSKLGAAHPTVARKLVDLADLYRADGRYSEAADLCARALAMQELALGEKAPETIRTLRELAAIYRAQGRIGDADRMLSRANQP
jgi:Tetratricopeptide repeat